MVVANRKEDRRAQVLEAISMYTTKYGYPPSYRDLAREVGIAHSMAFQLVEDLRTAGLVHERRPEALWHSRTITLTDDGRAVLARLSQ